MPKRPNLLLIITDQQRADTVAAGSACSTPIVQALAAEGEAFAEFHGQRLGYTQRVLWQGTNKYVFNGFAEDELYDLAADPCELTNLAGNPRHRNLYEAMVRRMWCWVRETGDATLDDAHYGMFRFAPVGPNAAER